ncbi:MAG: alpha/beta hydrolase-fold protein [Bacteroidota bacterium]
MKIRYFFIFFLLITSTFYAQVTFVINNLPENTPKNTSIYISGDFEGWTGGQVKYKLYQNKNTYSITLPKQINTINFKFTKGSWETVEADNEGTNIDNRTYTYSSKKDTIKISISNWIETSSKKSTAAKNVFILSEDFYIPQLDRRRKIWIYLPPKYDSSKKSYPVIYMHDGQNLFDIETSYAGEWEVDESLNEIFNENGNGFIVIGIDNGGEKRMDEYSPWKNNKYGGGEGDAYVEFITKNLKPHIDKNYRTLSNKENTAIIGSSMGGLISYYAGLKYSEIFGKVGVFSPSFWFSYESFDYAKTNGNLQNSKVFFLAGGKEGNNVILSEINQTAKDMNTVIDLLKNNGFKNNHLFSKIVPDGMHNEKLWRDNFKEAILWLFE